jgi:hypothetical protein
VIIARSRGLEELAEALAKATVFVPIEVGKSVMKEALALAVQWRAEADGHGHLPKLPNAVEVEGNSGSAVKVTFGDGNQGELAHIATFGSARSAPVMDPFQHVAAAEESLAKWVGQIGEDIL